MKYSTGTSETGSFSTHNTLAEAEQDAQAWSEGTDETVLIWELDENGDLLNGDPIKVYEGQLNVA